MKAADITLEFTDVMIGKLPIYRDLFRLTADLLNELDNLPKKYRYSVGDRMVSTSLETLHHLHAAYGAQDAQVRLDAMDRFATEFEMLRTLLRLCNESRLLSQRRLTCLFVSMEGISKQLAGWRKSTKEKQHSR